MKEEISHSESCKQFTQLILPMFSQKMSQDGCQQKTTPSDASWLESLELMLRYAPASPAGPGQARALCLDPNMDWPGESLMPNISEFPNDAKESSLSQVLWDGEVPRKYFLSPKACAGILRRAEKRGKMLPGPLARALKAVADSGRTLNSTGDLSPKPAMQKAAAKQHPPLPQIHTETMKAVKNCSSSTPSKAKDSTPARTEQDEELPLFQSRSQESGQESQRTTQEQE